MALRLQTVPAPQGARWVNAGFRVFARRPLAFTAMLLTFFFASLLASVLVPVVGSVVSLMALPLLTLGFMLATRSVLAGGPVHPGQLIEPLRMAGPRRKPLLTLCLLYGGLTLLVLKASGMVIGDAWDAATTVLADRDTPPDKVAAALSDPRLMWGIGLQATLIALLSVPFWHAPALVLWGEQGVAQSLFSSTVAVWRSKGAFTVYALVWVGLVIGLGTLSALLFSLLGLPQMATVAAVPITVVCMSAFYVTLYFTFVDSFRNDAAA